jgi:competence protein ComEC
MRRFYIRPAALLLAGLVAGIAVGGRLPGFVLPAGLLAAVAGLWVVTDLVRGRSARFSPLVLFVLLGYLSLQPWVAPRLPADHVRHFAGRQKWTIHGVVAQAPVNRGGRCRFVLRTRSLTKPGKRIPVSGLLRVTVLAEDAALQAGDRLSLKGRIKAIHNFANPGGFDYQRYMAYRGVWVTCYVRRDRLRVLGKIGGSSAGEVVDRLRRKVSGFIDRTPLITGSALVRAILKALLIGDRQAISTPLRNAFNRAGAGHLLAISGLHIGIVAAAAFFLFRWILSHIEFFLWRGWTASAAAVLTLLPVLAYGVLSGMSASTQRAVIMVAVFLAALMAGRQNDLMNTIAWAALVILAVFPPALFSVSFQLSFSAVFWIVYGLQQPWVKLATEKLRPRPVLKRLFSLVVVSLLAVLGTLPLVMLYFNQVSLVGPVTNVVLVPLMGFAAVPLGLGGVALLPLTHTGALVFLNLSAMPVAAGLAFIEATARIPLAALTTVTPSTVEIVAYYVLLGALPALFPPASASPVNAVGVLPGSQTTAETDGTAEKPVVRARRLAGALALGALLLLVADTGYWLYARWWRQDLRVTVLDVGQGSAALVELPRGRVMMVDGGGFSDNAGFDVGEKIVAPLLRRRKILTVDTLVLSHPNSDHLNGLLYIADHFHVRRVLSNGEGQPTRGYARFRQIIAQREIRRPPLGQIDRRQWINGARLDILSPPADFLDRRLRDRWRTVNNNSVVVRISLGRISFLFPADIERRMEKELVARWGRALESTVLLAPHHGSRTSSSPVFLNAVSPDVVVVSCGYRNRFGFPHKRVLERYRRLGAEVFTTADRGAVTMITDGRRLVIDTTRRVSLKGGALTN